MAEHIPTKRDRWSGRGAFVLAAIGSAVGLGNLWGFPYKLYAGGGGAFLIPYFIALLALGLPLMIGEFSVGHWSQQSPPGAFTRIARRYRFVGWWLVALAFVIVTYYMVVLAWCVLFLVDSVQGLFGTALPWAESATVAGEYFEKEVTAAGKSLAVTGLQWPVVAGLAVAWLLVYLSLFRGVKWVSKVVLITVPLPWLMLLILTVRGLTLDGAMTGLSFYLDPDWSKLLEANTWNLAFGQVFFTLSLGFAVMLSYASFLHQRSDLNNNAMIIGLGDLATSFIAGLAVFSTLGAMAVATNQQVTEVVESGPGLSFVTFPYALAQLPQAQALFALIFFVALLTLGIDSAFSIVEAVLASVCDNRPWSRDIVLPVICIIGFIIGLLFATTGGGVNWLGLVDSLVFGPVGILIAALAECYVIAWALKGRFSRRLRDHANERSDWKLHAWWEWTIKFIAPLLLIALFIWAFSGMISDALPTLANPGWTFWQTSNWPLLLGMLIFVGLPVVLSIVSRSSNSVEPNDVFGARVLAGIVIATVLVGLIVGLVRWTNAPASVQLANGDTLNGRVVGIDAQAGSVTFSHAVLGELNLTEQQLAAPPQTAQEENEEEPAQANAPQSEQAPEPIEVTLLSDGSAAGTLTVAPEPTVTDGEIQLVHPALGHVMLPQDQVKLPEQFEEASLSATAYVVLAVAFLVIFGGLAWCFWRAMLTAGGGDTEMEEETGG